MTSLCSIATRDCTNYITVCYAPARPTVVSQVHITAYRVANQCDFISVIMELEDEILPSYGRTGIEELLDSDAREIPVGKKPTRKDVYLLLEHIKREKIRCTSTSTQPSKTEIVNEAVTQIKKHFSSLNTTDSLAPDLRIYAAIVGYGEPRG